MSHYPVALMALIGVFRLTYWTVIWVTGLWGERARVRALVAALGAAGPGSVLVDHRDGATLAVRIGMGSAADRRPTGVSGE